MRHVSSIEVAVRTVIVAALFGMAFLFDYISPLDWYTWLPIMAILAALVSLYLHSRRFQFRRSVAPKQ